MQARNEKRLYIDNKIKEKLDALPKFMSKYELYIAENKNNQFNTRLQYVIHVSGFLDWLTSQKGYVFNEVEDIRQIDEDDVLEWKRSLEYYLDEDSKIHATSNSTVATKLSAVKSFFKFVENRIGYNVAKDIENPSVHSEILACLTDDEVEILINNIMNGVGTARQISHCKNYINRNMAIVSVFLCTGIRVSTLCELNIEDVNIKEKKLRAVTKGETIISQHLNEVSMYYLEKYIDERLNVTADTDALFISNRNKRMSVQSVRDMINTFSVGINKSVYPHMLRRTFGTHIYNETGDVYMAQSLLGHKNISTTIGSYVGVNDNKKKEALANMNLMKSWKK